MENQNYSFRSSLYGFHRGDVIVFLEKLSAAHEEALRLRDEQIRVLREDLAAAQEKLGARGPEPDEAEPAPSADDELEAYRRAERCERKAKARAEKLCSDAAGAVQSMSRQLTDRQAGIDSAADALNAGFDALQEAIAGILSDMDDARGKLGQMEQALNED